MQIGFIGLGKMGSRIVEKLLADGHEVVAWNRTKEIISNFKYQISNDKSSVENFKSSETIEDLVKALKTPRVIWTMLPAGDATQSALDEIVKYVEKGDIVIDGGNAFYKDTQRRSEEFRARGVGFLGIGVSGGIKAAERGYPMMIGGDKAAFEHIKPILDTLIKPRGPASTSTSLGGGYEYFGEGGAGHFVKMVHNGIEYGMMQAIGEGYGVLEKAPYPIDLIKVSELWQKNTIVTSFLNECAKDALAKDQTLVGLDGVIDANGEAEWTVNQAKEEGVFAENIDQSLDFRRRSKTDPKVASSFAARMVAALRHEFGGHDLHGKVEAGHKVEKK